MMDEQDIIRLSKELVETYSPYHNKSDKELTEEHYYVLTISKFILMKEKIVKKDEIEVIDNNGEKRRSETITFQIDNNIDYLSGIMFFVDKVAEENNLDLAELYQLFESKDLWKVSIEPVDYANKVIVSPNKLSTTTDNNLNNLKFFIYFYHAVRNQLAHGDYHINKEKSSVEVTIYGKKLNVSIELMNCIGLILNKGEKHEELTGFEKKFTITHSSINYFNEYQQTPSSILFDNIVANDNKKTFIQSMKYSKENKLFNYEEKDYYNKKIEIIDILKSLKKIMSNPNLLDRITNNKLNQSEKKKLYSLVNELLQTDKKYLEELINREDTKAKSMLLEIIKILGLKITPELSVYIASLYNYSQVVCAHKKDDDDYRCVHMSRITKVANPGKGIDGEPDKEIAEIIKLIKRECSRLNSAMNKNKGDGAIVGRVNSIKVFFINVLSLLAARNSKIISDIRNAIEHGNFKPEDMVDGRVSIELFDQLKHTDPDSRNFECVVDSNDLFNLIQEIETAPSQLETEFLPENQQDIEDKKIIAPDFTLKSFLEEIKILVSQRTYERLKANLEQYIRDLYKKTDMIDDILNIPIERILYDALALSYQDNKMKGENR